MHLQMAIERTRRSTWRWQSSELRDALGDRDCVNLEVYLEMVLAALWRDALGGRDRVKLEV